MSVVEPLKSLEELLSFDRPLLFVVEPLRQIQRGQPGEPKNMLLHDTAAYQEDKYIYGSNKASSYNFPLWQAIDTFVYYTDNMVSIPPPGWITAAHKHGVKVLGTFTLTSEEGTKAVNKIKGAGLGRQSRLSAGTCWRLFTGLTDGLSALQRACDGHFVIDLLAAVTEETHRAVPGSAVIWQESVQSNGTVEPQSELSDEHLSFFNSCDGIVLTSKWNEALLRKSAAAAGKRSGDVYAGIDVLARDTCYEGRYNMHNAVAIARQYGLSAAISGAGWVYVEDEVLHGNRDYRRYYVDPSLFYRANQCLLWALPEECRPQWRVTTLPLSTTFCQGFGTSLYKEGKATRPAAWFNLSKQELQPRDLGSKLCGGGGTAMADTLVSYNGGGCLRLEYDPKLAPGSKVIPYFRLFGFDLPLDSLCVSYTYKNRNQGSLTGHDINLVLKGGKYIAERDLTSGAQGDQGRQRSNWTTRKYLVKDATGSASLEEIGVSFNANEGIAFFIGELVVKRPEVAADSMEAMGRGTHRATKMAQADRKRKRSFGNG
ncbi:hypothetical protein MTO96_020453 [Rhipicephalus appendiculatus]